jgi:hypothetical protein
VLAKTINPAWEITWGNHGNREHLLHQRGGGKGHTRQYDQMVASGVLAALEKKGLVRISGGGLVTRVEPIRKLEVKPAPIQPVRAPHRTIKQNT